MLQSQLRFTPAENVAKRLAQGAKVARIASDLGVSVHTVRTHSDASYAKAGVGSQAELVRVAIAGPPTETVRG